MSSELSRRFEALKRRMRDVAIKTAEEAAQKVLEEAQTRVPVQSGRLKNSGDSKLVNFTQAGALSSVYYNVPYAPQVHENGNSQGYKWLEQASFVVDFQAILKKNWEDSE